MQNSILIENDIYKRKHGDKYDLVFKTDVLLAKCDIISSLNGKFIAVKLSNVVIIFNNKVSYDPQKDKYFLETLAMFTAKSSKALLKLHFEDQDYYIDSNAQITFSPKNNWT